METQKILMSIDTHTAGGPTRIITSGVPALLGNNMGEKLAYFEKHFDAIRKWLLLEPRGHIDMYGAIVTETTNPAADIGAFFMTTSGYLQTCVHSSIGVATALLKMGLLPQKCAEEITLDTAAGLVSLKPNYSYNKLVSISMQTKPAFLHTQDCEISINGITLNAAIVFSGVFFALINVNQLHKTISKENTIAFVELGKTILGSINQIIQVNHPEQPSINQISLVMFYEDIDNFMTNDIVIGLTGGIDRSPCGAGTGALAAYKYINKNLKIGDILSVQSIIGSKFKAQVISGSNIGPYPGAVLSITGSAYLTGIHQFIMEADDPFKEGFRVL